MERTRPFFPFLYFFSFPHFVTQTLKNKTSRGSLVAQWMRVHLTTQKTQVWSLIQEDYLMLLGATKPVSHNHWVHALEPASHNYWGPCASSLCSATREVTTLRSLYITMKINHCSPQLEKARARQQRPSVIFLKKKISKNNCSTEEIRRSLCMPRGKHRGDLTGWGRFRQAYSMELIFGTIFSFSTKVLGPWELYHLFGFSLK